MRWVIGRGERLGRRCSAGGTAFYLRNVTYTRQKNFMINMVVLQLSGQGFFLLYGLLHQLLPALFKWIERNFISLMWWVLLPGYSVWCLPGTFYKNGSTSNLDLILKIILN